MTNVLAVEVVHLKLQMEKWLTPLWQLTPMSLLLNINRRIALKGSDGLLKGIHVTVFRKRCFLMQKKFRNLEL
jgi:hypothetical protein